MLYNITKRENKNFFLFEYNKIDSTLNKCFDIISNADINFVADYNNSSSDKFTDIIHYLSFFLDKKADNIIKDIILSSNKKRIKDESFDNLILNKINEISGSYKTLKKKDKIKFIEKNKKIKKIIIFLDRFGYFDGEIKSSIDISLIYNVTRERVRQVTNSFFSFVYFYDINKFDNKKNKIVQEQIKEYFSSKITNYKTFCDLIPILYYFFIYLVINKNNKYKEEQNKIFNIYNPEISINTNNLYYNSINNIIKNILDFSLNSKFSLKNSENSDNSNFSSNSNDIILTETNNDKEKERKIKFIINFVFYYMNYYFKQKGYILKEINGIIILKNEHIFCCEKNIYDDWIDNWLKSNNSKIKKTLFFKNINTLQKKERDKVERILLKYRKFFLKKINKINFFKKQQINNTKIIVWVLLKNNKFMTTKEIADYIINNKDIYKEYINNNYKKYKNRKFCLLTFLKKIELIDNKLNNNNNNNNDNTFLEKQKNKIINKIKWIIYKIINNEITRVEIINKNYKKGKNKLKNQKNNISFPVKCKYIKKKENNVIYYKYNP